MSEELWRGRFGADPKIIGTSINLDQRPFTVIGIISDAFRTPFSASGKCGSRSFRTLSLVLLCLSADRIYYQLLGG